MKRFIALVWLISLARLAAVESPPNVVVIFADDLGYGDVNCFVQRGLSTPNLDRMAKEGMRFTDWHATQPVCSASRASLLTGCYPNRIGIHGALGPGSKTGISSEETTLPEMLKSLGYATAIVGKWHLGDRPEFLPTRHGFDEYFGLPYSNDMWPFHPESPKNYPPLPLYENEKIVQSGLTPQDQEMLTERYANRSCDFIKRHKTKPFFLYYAPSMPHVPLFVGAKFKGKSGAGMYGDVIMEIDWSVGEILKTIHEEGLDESTLVIFTSDNGPWLSYGNHAGSAVPLREGKGTVFEGGTRVPFIAKWPGKIPAEVTSDETSMAIDLLPTIAAVTGAKLPDRKIDGLDIWPILSGQPGAESPHEAFYFYYGTNELQAVRCGEWKLQFPHNARSMEGQTPGKDGIPGKYRQLQVGLELYHLRDDIGEKRNVAAEHPEVVERLKTLADQAREDLGDKLTGKIGTGLRSPGKVE